MGVRRAKTRQRAFHTASKPIYGLYARRLAQKARARWFELALALQLAGYTGLALFYLWYGDVNIDEGWYLRAANLVFDGKIPYRDFPFYQAPLSAYVYGISQVAAGPGILAGRLTTLAVAFVTLAAGIRTCWLLGGRAAALLFPVLFGVHPIVLFAFTTVRTEALTSAFLVLALWSTVERWPDRARWTGILTFLLLATLTRIAAAPLLFGAWIAAVWANRDDRQFVEWIMAVTLVAGVAGVLLVRFVGWDDVLFNLVTSQTRRHLMWKVPFGWMPDQSFRTKATALLGMLGQYPIHFAAGVAALAWCVSSLAQWWSARDRPSRWTLGMWAIAYLAWGIYLTQNVPRSIFLQYFVPSATLFAVGSAAAIGRAWELRQVERRALAVGVGCVALLLGLQFYVGYTTWVEVDRPTILSVRALAERVRNLTPRDGHLVTLDASMLVEPDRETPSEVAMGFFSYWPGMEYFGELQQRGVVNEYKLWSLIRDPSTTTVVLSDQAIGLILQELPGACRPFRPFSEREIHTLLPGLRQFRLAYVYESLSATAIGSGPAYVLVRAEAAPVPEGGPQRFAVAHGDCGLIISRFLGSEPGRTQPVDESVYP